MRNDELILQLDNADDLTLDLDGNGDLDLTMGDPVPVIVKNYEKLTNKPQINGREIIGNKTVAYYLQDGLILNGGDATGYPEPVIPPGVPQAEGVAF